MTEQTVPPLARTLAEWRRTLADLGEKPFRAGQIMKWIHQRGVTDPREMTDLSLALRERLAQEADWELGTVEHVHEAADGTRKLLFALAGGAKVECVLIPMTPGGVDSDEEEDDLDGASSPRGRVTLCISTQFGCAMGCTFCASGQAGLLRGLGAAEILLQVIVARRYLKKNEDLRNLVFMGMGEPLHHYDETKRALDLLTDPDAGQMSPRRITVSTVGLVPGIARLGADFSGKIGLALSLHAPDDETRSKIMPMNKRYPVQDLMRALRAYPLPPRRRITIEYTLIAGVNDSRAHAERLVALLRGMPVKINLIPMNSIQASEFQGSREEEVVRFREQLAGAGYSCFVRTKRGDDVSAACGQLALQAIPEDRLVRKSP